MRPQAIALVRGQTNSLDFGGTYLRQDFSQLVLMSQIAFCIIMHRSLVPPSLECLGYKIQFVLSFG